MIGTINDPRITSSIGEACGAAASNVRAKHARSTAKEKQEQAISREEGYTDDITDAIDEFGDALRERLDQLELPRSTRQVRVEFATQKAKWGEESKFGLDVGVRVIIETPGYKIEKAILVQCKRMTGQGAAGTFDMLAGDGEAQAEKMLKVSPSSFFFLFNGGERRDLLELIPEMPLICPWWAEELPDHSYFDPGVTVLPAARVLAMRDGKAKGAKFPTGAANVLAGSVPFGHFMVSLFGPCHVGDPRKAVIQLATPVLATNSIRGSRAPVSSSDSRDATH